MGTGYELSDWPNGTNGTCWDYDGVSAGCLGSFVRLGSEFDGSGVLEFGCILEEEARESVHDYAR